MDKTGDIDKESTDTSSEKRVILTIFIIGSAIVVLLVIAVGILKLRSNSNVTYNTPNTTPIPTGTTEVISILKETFIGAPKYVPPTKYAYYDNSGNIHISDFKNNDKIVAYSEGKYGYLYTPSVSPDGNYLVYNMLSEDTIKEFNQTPPYEWGGAPVMWLVNLRDGSKKIIDTTNYGVSAWRHDGKGLYFVGRTSDGRSLPIYYDLTKAATEEASVIPDSTESISPDNNYFVKVKTINPIDNSADSNNILQLFNSKGKYLRGLYKFESNEYHLNFVSLNKVLLTRNSFIDYRAYVFCNLEMVDVETGKVDTIERKKCIIPGDPSGFLSPQLTPDNNIVVNYRDRTITQPVKELNSLYIYDVITGKKSIEGEQDAKTENYFFTSPTTVVEVQNNYADEVAKSYSIHLDSHTIDQNSQLQGKKIISFF